MDWWQTLIATCGGLLILWLGLLGALWLTGRRTHDPTSWQEGLRLLPDVIRLLRRLAADPDLPRGVRVRLGLLLGYLLLPFDLVPDFIPVLGYADDAIVVALALRAVVRRAGPDALARHWPGTPAGLATLHRLARLPAPDAPGTSNGGTR
ncbi:YkvA family protein [Pseudonocardia sp. T1-2H]|uniref:YkvA family protein n=1 Tax=Pseudonocardia sp. T1-2H TaxID=3128899 RepID=UPI003100B6AF